MRTYDAFGYYYGDRSAKLELSVPTLSYDFSRLLNISHGGRNGLVLCFKRTGTDPGTALSNPGLNFEAIPITDLNLITKLSGSGIGAISDFDLTKPIYVFTYHDNITANFTAIEKLCYDILLSSNPETAYIPVKKSFGEKEKDLIPAKRGFGGLKKLV
jgi:hypothetical protein